MCPRHRVDRDTLPRAAHKWRDVQVWTGTRHRARSTGSVGSCTVVNPSAFSRPLRRQTAQRPSKAWIELRQRFQFFGMRVTRAWVLCHVLREGSDTRFLRGYALAGLLQVQLGTSITTAPSA